MFEKAGAVFALLTVLPSKQNTRLEDAASALWAFPFAGFVIGAISGGIGAVLIATGLEPLLAGVCTVFALLLLTGMHHLDGLADLADAFMVRGDQKRKIAALEDSSIGIAGVASVVIYLFALISAIHSVGPWELWGIVIAAEVIAKLSMVITMRMGSTTDNSSAAPFAKSAKDWTNVAGAVSIGIIIASLVLGVAALGAIVIGVIVALLVVRRSIKSLGVLRGDALGAANELSRLGAVIVLVSIL